MKFIEAKRVLQPNDWSCFACSAAMLAGETLEEFCTWAGHDGSEISEDSPFPDGRRGFRLHEVAGYLASRGMILGAPYSRDGGWPQRIGAALMIVRGRRHNHAVVWTGECVVDPNPERPDEMRAGDYQVETVWPVFPVA
jgi:hypothetical protein